MSKLQQALRRLPGGQAARVCDVRRYALNRQFRVVGIADGADLPGVLQCIQIHAAGAKIKHIDGGTILVTSPVTAVACGPKWLCAVYLATFVGSSLALYFGFFCSYHGWILSLV